MTSPGTSGSSKAPQPPRYRHFTEFAEIWLLPTIAVRLAEANRENTYTWCTHWWAHRAVAVRIAHLHSAFEAQCRSRTAGSLSTYLLSHVDAHCRVILDAANGPLHRCTRASHVSTPSLPFDPLPVGWIKPATHSRSSSAPNNRSAPTKKPPRYRHLSDFVQDWLLPVTSVRLAANHREGQYTWCRQWWRHQNVAVRFAGLHLAFEAALRSEDAMAMSSLFVRHIDPHFRVILDAANGPLHRCNPDQHTDTPGLPATAIPANWFGIDGTTATVDRLGFGPDFRALAAEPAGGDQA
ncbi:DUF4913 domain-containing protein [Nocardia cyriacigeorgica]|uniref:DUF4913 domain-containing protein n=1 Tax=Nocardia cyriacigeorgica TaxID=135487 RepID=UPI000CEB6724|nr:DUF4913 domain-containing protein [Nocardia cyriacigeorgica]AVH20317.1 hypothetical protein C5B73_01370 [Nocardia cyriacigeorgica]